MKTFAQLFRKYRLRSEFETIAAFSNALAERGYFYEESIYYHWQKGTRVPHDRKLVLTLVKIFVEKGALQTTRDVNEFLESGRQGFLTENEAQTLDLKTNVSIPFQVPTEINDFVGRETSIETVKKAIKKQKVILLYGPPGIGKTTLAIKIGHLFKDIYPDGVLWYKVDSSNISDILLSIAQMFGENISSVKDIEIRASIVRALLAEKKVLLIFDNVYDVDQMALLLPNSSSSTVLITSRKRKLNIQSTYEAIELQSFTVNELSMLFTTLFGKQFTAINKKDIFAIAKVFGYLPLAVHIVARYLKQHNLSPKEYLIELQNNTFKLENFKYDNENLLKAIELSFIKLDQKVQRTFISLGIFDGKDFSIDAVAYINDLNENVAKEQLRKLFDVSFIEKSQPKRYRMHPVMKQFARTYLDKRVYLKGGQYYESFLNSIENKRSHRELSLEVDNIVHIFKKCYEYGFWDLIITLWNPLEKMLSETNEIKKLKQLRLTIDTSQTVDTLQKLLTIFAALLLIMWFSINLNIQSASLWGASYSLLFSFIPFIGGLVGIFRAKSWGLFKSNIGKAVFYISVGLFSWGSGNLIWAYYNFFQKNDIPYPSLADIGYLPAYPLWIIGIIYLSKATGAKFSIQKIKTRFLYLILSSVSLALSYYILFFVVDGKFHIDDPILLMFDIYYPAKDIVILTIAIAIFGLSVNFFGGKYRLSIYSILCGFIFLYVADLLFSYTTSNSTFYTGGITDLFFMIGFYFITMGSLSFYLTPNKKS